ncbi:DUF6282 family protein [Treponema primitia]|uniref:DUF6282 family protein n=1 Tax=Treponema primitia TaxID=88058 RepID=UPI0039805AA0
MPGKEFDLIKGGYDLHVHTAPSHYIRLFDDFEYAKELDKYEMGGSIIKAHFGTTCARAQLANKYSGAKAKLYGALTLDWAVGGINPYAVQSEILLGAAIIWMPTFHAKNDQVGSNFKKHPVSGPGIEIIDEKGKLLPVVYDIIDLVKSADIVLATGHLSPKESYALCKEGIARRATMYLTHPDRPIENVSIEMQIELSKLGVYIEKSYINVLKNQISITDVADRIKKISPKMCVMTTDLGKSEDVSPPIGLATFVKELLNFSFTDQEIKMMVSENPKKILHV